MLSVQRRSSTFIPLRGKKLPSVANPAGSIDGLLPVPPPGILLGAALPDCLADASRPASVFSGN